MGNGAATKNGFPVSSLKDNLERVMTYRLSVLACGCVVVGIIMNIKR
jgi:hypothetical protein